MKTLILALVFLALAPAAWAGGQGNKSAKVRIYDQNYHYRGFIQNGRVYDENYHYQGKIEKAPRKGQPARRRFLGADYKTRYYLEKGKKN
jgi:hypothetical protein